MKFIQRLALAILFVLSATVATPASAHSRSTICTSVLTTTTIPSDLVVPEGVYCELNNTTVQGNIQIGQRSTLALYESRIEGTITGTRFELVTLQNTAVGKDIRLSSGVSIWLEGATIEGDVHLNDGLDTRVLQSQVSGDLLVRRSSQQVQFCGTTVNGDARFADNEGWVNVGGDLSSCAANTVRGTLRVHHNQQAITVANNAVGRDLVCTANDPAPVAYKNQVAGRTRGQCGVDQAVYLVELGQGE
jgi:hypothetical protein